MKLRLVLFLFCALAAAPLRGAQVDYFLRIDGVEGESVDREFPEHIEISSWSWGMANPSAGGGQTGRVSFQDLHFTKRMDKSSPVLMLGCASGQHYPQLVLTLRRGGEMPFVFLRVTMDDVLVSSYQTGGSNAEDRPTEQISFNFGKVRVEYIVQDPNGGPGERVLFGWDVAANMPL